MLKKVFFFSTGKTNQYDRLLIREIYHKVIIGIRVFDETLKIVHNFTNYLIPTKLCLQNKLDELFL